MPFDFNTHKKKSSRSVREDSPWTVPGESQSSPSGWSGEGFQNPPQVGRAAPYRPDSGDHLYTPTPRPSPYRKPRVRRNVEIPWNILLPILGVILILVFLYVFRNEITAFLSTLLSWVIVLIIVIAILKSLLGIRR